MSDFDLPDGVPDGLLPPERQDPKERHFQVVSREFSVAGLAESSGAPPIIIKTVKALLGERFTKTQKFIALHEVKRRSDGSVKLFNNASMLDAQNLDDLITLLVRMKDEALKHGVKSLKALEEEMGPCDCGERHTEGRWCEQYKHKRKYDEDTPEGREPQEE